MMYPASFLLATRPDCLAAVHALVIVDGVDVVAVAVVDLLVVGDDPGALGLLGNVKNSFTSL